MIKKIKRWLQLWDGVWTIPLTFILTLVVSSFLIDTWGPEVGIFPPGLMNAAFIAAFMIFTGYTLSNILINLYHRGWFRYYYGPDVKRDFHLLPIWLKILFVPLLQLVLLLLFYFLVAHLV